MRTSLHLYNTRSRKVELFSYPPQSSIGIYVCGPTVYGAAHLGHARSGITFDLLFRYLKYLGYQVTYIRNITDVGHLVSDLDQGEDKIIAQATKEKRHPMAVAQHYTNSYRADMQLLRVLPPTIEPCATGHIPEQIAMVEKLLAKGLAYLINGSVYFDVEAYSQHHVYGSLSGRKIEELMTGTRHLTGTSEKRHPADFALWKKADQEHIMRWASPWGEGFPGWHLECTAMSHQYLGPQFAIHGGGLDLTFPHHECEIAQAIGLTGKEPARWWMHHNLVQLNDQKMSKSAGNFITLQQVFQGNHPLLSQGYHPMIVRFFLLHAHYRSPIVCTDEALQRAAKQYSKLLNSWKISQDLNQQPPANPNSPNEKLSSAIIATSYACYDSLNDDLNTPQLLANLFELSRYIRALHRGEYTRSQVSQKAWKQLHTTYDVLMGEILGFYLPPKPTDLIQLLIKQYQEAKQQKDYDQVDIIRHALQQEGMAVQDNLQNVTWSYQL
ncbi:MAG: cysteine--tRNA ligase [Bacteroidota bacterium]